MNRCPTREQLEQALAEQLGEPEVQAISDHLEGCARCRSLMEDLTRRGTWEERWRPSMDTGDLEKRSTQRASNPHRTVRSTADGHWPSVPGYDIVGELGRGGMGIVYKARQVGLNRVVALKMVLDGDYARPEYLLRFEREAELIACLSHPNFVHIYEVGRHDQRPFFAMEFVEGGSLAEKLNGTPLPNRPAAELVEVLARAVQVAHEAGIVHRDLKPSNIMLTVGGAPKIMDFGLAKRLEAGGGLTQSGDILGTPRYMAPEQVRGSSKAIGPGTDVYALGAILYEMLTGRPPFQGASLSETLLQAEREDPVPPRRLQSKVPRDLETICLKCLDKEPARRYTSAELLADDLGRFLSGQPIQARPAGPTERTWRWCRRNPTVATLAAACLLVLVSGLVATTWKWREAENLRFENWFQRLKEAPISQVPAIIREQEDYRRRAEPRLRRLLLEPAPAQEELRVRLALWPADPEQSEPLKLALLKAQPPEVRAICELLSSVPQKQQFTQSLWQTMYALEAEPDPSKGQREQRLKERRDQRLRVACALAALDPNSPDWEKVTTAVAESLLANDIVFLRDWLDGLRPIRQLMLKPLCRSFRDKDKVAERLVAANILADYAADQVKVLADLIMDADTGQHEVLFPKLLIVREQAIDLMKEVLKSQSPATATEAAKDTLAHRQARAAVVLLKLGHAEPTWRLFQHSKDPSIRSLLLHELGPLQADPQVLIARLRVEPEVSAKRALILSLGEFTAEQLPDAQRQGLVPLLLDWYRAEPDPGIHGAIDWLLRHAKEGPLARQIDWRQAKALQAIDLELAGIPAGERRWYVNDQGQTFTILGPDQFNMGSPLSESRHLANEKPHRQRVGRTFAIATKDVTVAQFKEFLKAHPEVDHRYTPKYSPDRDGPMISVSWYEAAQYCRWLSEKEHVPSDQMCYPEVEKIEKCKDGRTPLPLEAGYLSRTGYRLPTEAEWEYACRAGALTSRSYGRSADVLRRYAWYLNNSEDQAWSVGQKKPNDFGLFDMHGNVWQWCQNRAEDYSVIGGAGEACEDKEDIRDIADGLKLVLRGGQFAARLEVVRAAYRHYENPSTRKHAIGFRVARTSR
jgi:formylglycine-generating enzyme required for sulfatase activity/predicted Ser/Thr protein kinase